MGWLKAGIITTVISALVITAAMLLVSVAQKGVEPLSLLAMLLLVLPLGLLVSAPICLVVLPAADAILESRGARLFRDMAIVGAIAGALVPPVIVFIFRIRPPGMLGTLVALMMLAGLVGGAAAGLFYADLAARLNRR